ncbi:TonB-dependent siderophore receptor [Campylobacter mucosalis]|uniref:TonB-dependent siderophore receptor n=1 Tax=Campylobacter mucosalis TaxID=202 RepID=UPI0014700811|nr:TonB-dependent siderophore receptor [Campylobacter mucosalis]
MVLKRVSLALCLALPHFAFSSDVVLDSVEVVESVDDGYRARTSQIGKSNSPILEIPQTLNVVTNQQLKDKKPESLAEALQNVSGISYANSTGGIFDAVLKRGFGKNRDGSIMRNGTPAGVRHSFNATVSSVEVLKGPASLLYGMQDPGGIINLVTKKPLYEFQNEISAGIGNNHYWNVGFDTTGPIGDSGFAYRLIFDRSTKDYWREYGEYKSFIIAPSLSYKGDDYRVDLAYTHSKYTDPLDRGQYMVVNKTAAYKDWDGKFLLSDSKKRLDEKFNEITGKINTFDINFEKNIAQNWLLKANYAFTRSMHEYGQMRVRDFTPPKGDITRENSSYTNFEHRTHAGGVNLNGFIETGTLTHNVLLGVDLKEELRRRPGSAVQDKNSANNININNPKFGVPMATSPLKNDSQYQRIRSVGGYLQDNINITENFIFVLGARYEYYDQLGGKGDANGGNFKAQTDNHDGKFIYQTGLVYLLNPELSIYANYAQSFKPQLSMNEDMSSLDPEEGVSSEVGTKFQNDDITATLALFNIDKKNVAYTINKVSYASGKVNSKGVEIDFNGRVSKGLTIGASYAYTKTKTLEDKQNTWKIGKPFDATPKNQASLFANYDFSHLGLSGFRVGGGARYFGSWLAYSKVGNGYKMPHAITYDAFASYTTKISGYETNFQLNVKNLTNKLYYTSYNSEGANILAIVPGYARQIMLSASVKF